MEAAYIISSKLNSVYVHIAIIYVPIRVFITYMYSYNWGVKHSLDVHVYTDIV
jgi:hypothetical protein